MTDHPQKHQTAIEVLEAKIDALEDELVEARDKITALERDQTWTAHLDWSLEEDDVELPIPRIEIRIECFGPDDIERVDEVHVTQYLILRHNLGHFEAIPLSAVRMMGTWPSVAAAVYDPRDGDRSRLNAYRLGSEAWHNAEHLKLPLFITANDGERDVVRRVIGMGAERGEGSYQTAFLGEVQS